MANLTLGYVEEQFAEIIWANAPISSGKLVQLASDRFQWKKSTTYTVLKRFAEKGLIRNENGTVIPLLTREEYAASQSEQVVNHQFQGSLPAFIAAFTSKNRLSADEIRRIREMIDSFGKEDA